VESTRKPYNFQAAILTYVVIAALVALFIHNYLLRSPKYSWMLPVNPAQHAVVNPSGTR
jgi:hypothetical protein